jgi:hypothetical protein
MNKNQGGKKRISRLKIIHVGCNRLIIQYLIQQIAQSVTIIRHLPSSYMLRSLQGHHQGGIQKGIEMNQILWKMCATCTSLTELAGFFILKMEATKSSENLLTFSHSVTTKKTVLMTLAAVTNPDRSTNIWLCMNDSFPNLHCTVQSNVPTRFFFSLCKLELKEHITCFSPDEQDSRNTLLCARNRYICLSVSHIYL